eukprot:12439774-Alexandrium_andersonii.AAC.1
MAERPSFLRPGPEKRCRHLGAFFFFSAGAAETGAEGWTSAGVVSSRSHLPFDLPPPFFFGEP